ncbi:MAG: CARDB domain-containing protein [Patescibacteria group bacterium]
MPIRLSLTRLLPVALIALSLVVAFLVFSVPASKAQCGYEYDIVCHNTHTPGVTSGTNGCISGIGEVVQTAGDCGGGEGGGGGGGGGGTPTPTADLSANPQSISQGSSSTLTATSDRVTSCSINNGVGVITPNTANAINVAPQQTTTYTLTCTDISGSPITDTATVSVTAPTPPDLVGQVGGARTGRSQEAMTLYGAAFNQGSSAAGSFPNTIQVCDQSCFGVNQTLSATALSSLATGATSQVSASYTPPAVSGVTEYMYRVCANTSVTTSKGVRTWSNPATESSYTNNCSGWQYLYVQQDPVPPTATVVLLPAYVLSGGSSTLTWGSTNATSCTGTNFSTGGTTSGSIVVTATQNTTYTVTCTGAGGSATDSDLLTVYPGLLPDLIVPGTVSAGSAVAGVPTSLSAVATNIGLATSGSFPVLFEVTSNGGLVQSAYVSGLSSGASGTGSASYTFPSSGSYSVRACANFSESWVAITSESNYLNNCGPVTTVNVSAGPSLSCSVSSTTLAPGQSVTYSANPSGGASGPYAWTASDGGSHGTGATVTRTFPTAGSYSMNVDTSSTAVSYCPAVTVAVNWCLSGTASLSITAVPNRVRAGQSSEIRWSASGVNGQNATCSVSGPGVSWTSPVSAPLECSAAGFETEVINTQSTYTLTCGTQSRSVTVNVIPSFQEF